MKFKVLITAPYFQPVIEKYKDFFDKYHIEIIAPPIEERMSEKELLKYIKDIDGIICGDDRITKRVLESALRLKVISKWGTGIDSIDLEAAAFYKIPVKNTPNAFTDAVADTMFTFMLCFTRKTPWLNENIRHGGWQKQPAFSLKERSLGIIGVGNIGKAITKRANSFGMRILGNDVKKISPDFIKKTGIEIVSLNQLLKESDFISLNCDLNPTSYRLLNKEKFALIKPTSFIINTARGPIINEKDLISALASKQIAGAGLDVFENEPLPIDSPLRKFSNVLFSPHNANSSPSAWKYVHENTLKNLIEELSKYEN